MANTALIKIIDFWQKNAEEKGLQPRLLVEEIDTDSNEIVDIVGPRRVGKSSVMKLLINKLKTQGNSLYINFEDPYFLDHNSPRVIEEIIETYKEYFQSKLKYLFFDEVQNVISWEKAVRKLRDSGQYKIFLSGSSSKLLSSEFASLLTGRHITYKLLPLSFEEYLLFIGVKTQGKKDIILRSMALGKHFTDYLQTGGFPAEVISRNQELLKQYYMDIVQSDIIRRYEVREKGVLERMGIYLLTNSAKTISLASLRQTYEISHEVVSNYLEYFKEAFLIFEVPQFAYSLKTQQKALKKIYAIDTGLANAVSFRFSQDSGRVLETCVFLELKRRGSEIYYYKTDNGREVDFLTREGETNRQLIQVAWDISDEKTKKREISVLADAMEEQKVTQGLLLTNDLIETVTADSKIIVVKPVYQWLLE